MNEFELLLTAAQQGDNKALYALICQFDWLITKHSKNEAGYVDEDLKQHQILSFMAAIKKFEKLV